jgi:Xaa-Pro aminopeptidase
MRLSAIQEALRATEFDAWLLYDFRDLNPIAGRVAGFDPADHHSRRWFCLIPREGQPHWLHHAIEAHLFADRPGSKTPYVGWRDLEAGLRELLKSTAQVAMEYSPGCAIPYVSRIDAGCLELVRSTGTEVGTSADLVSAIEATWDEKGLAGHRLAAGWLAECATNTHAYLAECATRGKMPSEYEVQQRMVAELTGRGMVLEGDPIVASGPHSANPHYAPTESESSPIRLDDVVLLDLWGREDRPGSICADITWMAYVGEQVPQEVEDVWQAVIGARDAAVAFLRQRWADGKPVRGYEVDQAARGFLAERDLDTYFIHRLGHSIGTEVHGNGANLDHLETRDERLLLTHTGFSVEPGVYLPGKFGVRSEIDVHLSPEGPEITTPMQEKIPALLG